jgi:large subunit ribosomal protein L4
MYRAAMRSILSELIRQDRLSIVDKFKVDAPKTKDLVEKLNAIKFESGVIVTDEADDNLYLSARNLHNVEVLAAGEIDPVSLVGSANVLMTVGAVQKIGEMLG